MPSAEAAIVTPDRPTPIVALRRAAGRAVMSVGGSLLFAGLWIEAFGGLLRRSNHPMILELIEHRWVVFGAGVAFVVLGAVIARRRYPDGVAADDAMGPGGQARIGR
jgi:hypothetical protein